MKNDRPPACKNEIFVTINCVTPNIILNQSCHTIRTHAAAGENLPDKEAKEFKRKYNNIYLLAMLTRAQHCMPHLLQLLPSHMHVTLERADDVEIAPGQKALSIGVIQVLTVCQRLLSMSHQRNVWRYLCVYMRKKRSRCCSCVG